MSDSGVTEARWPAFNYRPPLSDAEAARLAELRARDGSGNPLTEDEANEMAGLVLREAPVKYTDPSPDDPASEADGDGPGAPAPQPLTDREKARLAGLRAMQDVLDDDECAELDDLTARESVVAAPTPVETPAGPMPPNDLHARLAADINQPPEAAPVPEDMAPQHAVFQHLFGVVEHLIGGFGHLAATVPQAGGLGPMLQAATARLNAARQAFLDASSAYGDFRRGDYGAAIRDGEAAVKDGAQVIEPTSGSTQG